MTPATSGPATEAIELLQNWIQAGYPTPEGRVGASRTNIFEDLAILYCPQARSVEHLLAKLSQGSQGMYHNPKRPVPPRRQAGAEVVQQRCHVVFALRDQPLYQSAAVLINPEESAERPHARQELRPSLALGEEPLDDVGAEMIHVKDKHKIRR